MKKIYLLSIALMVSTIIFAQRKPKDPADIALRQTEKMNDVVSLNETQYATIKGINEKYAGKMIGLRSAPPAEKAKKRTEFKSLRQEKQKEINEVLTPDQEKSWNTYRAEKKNEKKQNREARFEKKKAHLKTELSLTDEQVEKLLTVNKEFHRKQLVLKNEKGLSHDQLSEKRKALKAAHNSAMKDILTAEQLKKYKESNARKKQRRFQDDK